MRSKLLTGTFLGIALFALQSCRENNITAEESVSPQAKASAVTGSTFSVPVAGNSFLTVKPSGANEVITSTKLGNCTNSNTVISTYFRVSNPGTISIGLKHLFRPEPVL